MVRKTFATWQSDRSQLPFSHFSRIRGSRPSVRKDLSSYRDYAVPSAPGRNRIAPAHARAYTTAEA
jgi:hypothetical protein